MEGRAMDLSEKIEFFFAPPSPMQSGPMVSTLHLVRREVQDCLIGRVVEEDAALAEPRRQRVFATSAVLLAGIDLLAKFYDGSNTHRKSPERFRQFAAHWLFERSLYPDIAADILQQAYSCQLSQSFALRTSAHAHLSVAASGSRLAAQAIQEVNGVHLISIEGLVAAFLIAVQRYRAALSTDRRLQTNFERMFDIHGALRVQQTRETLRR